MNKEEKEERDYTKLYKALGYAFNREDLLQTALTHSSYCYEHRLSYRENNERLEFLGDSIFNAVITDELCARLPENAEGHLSRLRASIVCEQSLYQKAKEIRLSDYMRLGRGERITLEHSQTPSLAADALEATIGAIYRDGGWDCAKNAVLRLFGDTIEEALRGRLQRDYKTMLQELLQSRGDAHISYQIERESGPDHNKTFFVSMRNNGVVWGRGSGSTKKEAQQNAAKMALEKMRG